MCNRCLACIYVVCQEAQPVQPAQTTEVSSIPVCNEDLHVDKNDTSGLGDSQATCAIPETSVKPPTGQNKVHKSLIKATKSAAKIGQKCKQCIKN